jgi:hypothetical protein
MAMSRHLSIYISRPEDKNAEEQLDFSMALLHTGVLLKCTGSVQWDSHPAAALQHQLRMQGPCMAMHNLWVWPWQALTANVKKRLTRCTTTAVAQRENWVF